MNGWLDINEAGQPATQRNKRNKQIQHDEINVSEWMRPNQPEAP